VAVTQTVGQNTLQKRVKIAKYLGKKTERNSPGGFNGVFHSEKKRLSQRVGALAMGSWGQQRPSLSHIWVTKVGGEKIEILCELRGRATQSLPRKMIVESKRHKTTEED